LSFQSNNGAAGTKATLDIDGTKVEGFDPFTWSKALADSGYPLLKVASGAIDLDKAQTDALNAAIADKKTADAMKILSDARIAKDPAAKKIADIAHIDGVEAASDGSGASKVTVSEIATGSADKAKINWPVSITTLPEGAADAVPARLTAMPVLSAATAAALRLRRKRLVKLLMVCPPCWSRRSRSVRRDAGMYGPYTGATAGRFTPRSGEFRSTRPRKLPRASNGQAAEDARNSQLPNVEPDRPGIRIETTDGPVERQTIMAAVAVESPPSVVGSRRLVTGRYRLRTLLVRTEVADPRAYEGRGRSDVCA
jgi:hypothetical protein